MNYKLKLSNLIKTLLIATILMSLTGLTLNILTIVEYSNINSSVVGYIIISALSFVLFVFCVSVLFFSNYSIKGATLSCRFGIFFSKYNINDILVILQNKEQGKLALSFKNNTYTYVLIDKKSFDDFSENIRNINKTIIVKDEN